MNKKNVIISSVIAGLVIVSGIYYAIANDDYTCYNYISTVSSCLSDQTTCDPWVDGVRYCDGTNETIYSVGSTYRCSSYERMRQNSRLSGKKILPNAGYSENGTCRVKYTDTQTPQVIGGGIE